MRSSEPQAVKYFIGALFSDQQKLAEAFEKCSEMIGDLGYQSEDHLFESTNYYDAEMGTPIYRRIIGFELLMSPGELARFKNICNTIEDALAVDGQRKVNLDIGYLDLHKVILASAKYNGQKIYIGEGIYADLTLIFERGAFHPVDNTFPDFRKGLYDAAFKNLRECYKNQLKTAKTR